MKNIRDALSSLVSRDQRIKIFPNDFWVIDKSLANRTQESNIQTVKALLSPVALESVPWVYDFRVRAKVFAG